MLAERDVHAFSGGHDCFLFSFIPFSSGSDFEDEIQILNTSSSAKRSKRPAKRKQKIVSSDSDQSVEIVKSKLKEAGVLLSCLQL